MHELLLDPTLRVEDGARVFAHFYAKRELAELFRFKAGYVPLLPNWVGYLSVRLPVTLSPYFLTIVPTLLAIAAFTSFFAAPFRVLVWDDRVRFVGCVALALAPVGQYLLVSHTDYSIWSALFLALLWAMVSPPRRDGLAVASFSAQQVLIWTSPVSFVLAPIHVFYLLTNRDRRERAWQLAMLFGHALHFFFGLEGPRSGLALDRLADGDAFAEAASAAYRLLGARVAVDAVFGSGSAAWARSHVPWLSVAWQALVLILLCAALVRPSPRIARRLLAFLAYAIASLTLVVAFTRFDLQQRVPQRYVYVQALSQVLLTYLLGLRFLEPCLTRLALRWPRVRLRFFPAYAGVVLALLALESSARTGAYRDSEPENAVAVRRCMEKIARLEAEHGGPCGFSITCPKQRDWAIKIRAPACRR
jgi:hypothetical protein